MPVQLSTILIFQNIGRKHQKNKPCYVPKLEEGQVLSIANSKFAIGPVDNQIDLILTTATILPINVVGTASVSDLVLTTNLGIQFECTGKDKPTEIPITLFHPNESCLKSQTTMLKRGSSIFFSGALTSTEESFIQN
ncbi:hypothetical protein RirG_016650 [Rhizophagus irregularis DAOM 197198w]|uniref:Uncharacterized protein n=1 Tax=Rhizophagus irregularis (strain DAOM 197198w) TaxID=1432141 RepID=A0A015NFV9_RHIIW|nr:hypothetical protein RirG_016650 [Rhizophagus irregularis DAOM 197198w]